MPEQSVVVESNKVIVGGGVADFINTITLDGAVTDLSAHTLKSTIRRADDDPYTLIDVTLEDIVVLMTPTPAIGKVTTHLTTAMSVLLAPPVGSPPTDVKYYYLQYHDETGQWYPQLFRFGVRRRLD